MLNYEVEPTAKTSDLDDEAEPKATTNELDMSEVDRLWALRGAVKAERNDAKAIVSATRELISGLIEGNSLTPEAIVSIIFTSTGDLNAEFPAVAARELGLDTVPLICSRELDVPGAMRGVIRVLVHYYAPADHTPAHLYLGETRNLRADLHSAQ